MPTQSVVFIVIFALALAGVVFVTMKLWTKVKGEERVNDAAEEESHARQNTPAGKQRAARADLADAKAAALGGIEADEAAGRTPRRRGHHVATYRNKERHAVNAQRDRENTTTA